MQNSQTGGSEPAAAELGSFGKYHLIASLGQGGMANVFLALMAGPSGFNKLLVIKIMRQDLLAGSEETTRMFMAEARLAARLVHPNIVHTYEVGEQDGRYFLAMEYLDGQPLSSVLNRARGDSEIPLAEYLRMIAELARGLHYAHTLRGFQGEPLEVVHRDVSPQNVIVTYDGQVKLLDFGIAKTADAEHLTQVGTIKGKLDYIAPEQLRSDSIDGRADIFALGAMMWEVISGHRFAGGRRVGDVNKMQARLVGGER
ncbi:MAG TPA: serine/threonine-protein kinase, partial [Polyangiales bacterium]